MARPSKPAAVLRAEGKSHRTKAELEAREKAESEMLSGAPLYERPEVQKNKVAHAEFLRVAELMQSINKDDALYSAGINTYCLLHAEIIEMEKRKKKVDKLCKEIKAEFDKLEAVNFEQVCRFTDKLTKLEGTLLSLSSEIDKKRRIMLTIDKENVMTISAALRSIPKTPDKAENPLLAALAEDDEDE